MHRWRLVVKVVVGLMLACLLYCLIVPKQYEATARVGLRTAPASSLNLEPPEPYAAASILAAPVQQETVATVLRSDQLAWRVILDLKLYQDAAFRGHFTYEYPGFQPDAPSADARDYLLDRFKRRLQVQTLPRTLLIQIRFRCLDAALSAKVVNDLIRVYGEQESEANRQATGQASEWLQSQLKDLKLSLEKDRQRLAAFQREHGILSTPLTLANGQQGESQHAYILVEIDELGKQLVTATADRILREAEFRAASGGDPELVLANDLHVQSESGRLFAEALQQIHQHQSALEEEQAKLSIEHGPNFPRIVEIGGQLQDLGRQKKLEDARLVEGFRDGWQTAADREEKLRQSLAERTRAGMQQNEAATEYAVMRQEADSSQDLYLRVLLKAQEAGLAAGIHTSPLAVVDPARQPVKPVVPDLTLLMAVTFFVSLWLAIAGALLAESLSSSANTAMLLLAVLLATVGAQAQAPTPSTSGLPTGVARIPFSQETKNYPNPQGAPTVWNSPATANLTGQVPNPVAASAMPAPIAPGDTLEVSESHVPEFRSTVLVSPAGTVTLPMIKEVAVSGLDMQAAARAIEAALVDQGMLLHPQVTVLVIAYAGQDVSVMGEVARPGVYPYTFHHRLLDLISSASGLAPSAGRLVNVFHRDDPKTPHPVVLDPNGTDNTTDHNPELLAGDTVQVSRAGLVYVIGDVIRPGGFPVEPAQGLTVVQALTLAWGMTQNAAASKALLIREQKGGRVLTTLNLKRMLRGQEPDPPVHDRDILFIPDSTARNLWNRTAEAAIQSAVGVTIYAGLVYSQRF